MQVSQLTQYDGGAWLNDKILGHGSKGLWLKTGLKETFVRCFSVSPINTQFDTVCDV